MKNRSLIQEQPSFIKFFFHQKESQWVHDREIRVRADNGCMSITNYVQDTNPAFSQDNKNLSKIKKAVSPISILCLHILLFQIQLNTSENVVRFSKTQHPHHKTTFRKMEFKKGTYVTLLKVLMMTKHRVTRRTILAGTTSVGIRKLTHDITTNIAVGRYTLSKYGVTYLDSRISKPYTE